MKNISALEILIRVLESCDQEEMVRHEAAEALGALGDASAIPVLERYSQDPSRVISETCQIALASIEFQSKSEWMSTGFSSVDPAPPASNDLSISELESQLLDPSLDLFKRYRAMFALRDRGDTDSIQALGKGFQDASALFRHEIAFVFGQLQHPDSVPYLIPVLQNSNEEPMVRHEAAEALGSIAHPACKPVLEDFAKDGERVVRESCEVGLDMYEYENSNQFQYTEPLLVTHHLQ